VLDAALKALWQMPSPAFRAVLFKSIALAVVLVVFLGIGLHRLLLWLAEIAEHWGAGALGHFAELPLAILAQIVSIAGAVGIILGSIFLMPAVTAIVASFYSDEIALAVERSYYPAEPPGVPVPVLRAVVEGARTALLAALVYLVSVPFLLFAGFGAIFFFLATAYLLGRQYFELAAMRFHPPHAARRLREAHQGNVFLAGMLIAAFVSLPLVNLATPLFGTAFMVHVYKRLVRRDENPI
jgi:CysZ protein